MSDTPRTDDAELGYGKVTTDFARQLERELNAANERIKRLEEAGDRLARYAEELHYDLWNAAKEAKP